MLGLNDADYGADGDLQQQLAYDSLLAHEAIDGGHLAEIRSRIGISYAGKA